MRRAGNTNVPDECGDAERESVIIRSTPNDVLRALCPQGDASVVVWSVTGTERRWSEHHVCWDLCLVNHGQVGVYCDWRYRGVDWCAMPGTVMLMQPGEKHFTRKAVGPASFELLRIPAQLFENVAKQHGHRSAPALRVAQSDDAAVYAEVLGLCSALRDPEPPLNFETRLVYAVRVLLQRCCQEFWPDSCRHFIPHYKIRRLTEMLDEDDSGDLSLAHLAKEVGMTPWHMLRSFKRATGVTPGEWRDVRRMSRARLALEAGTPVTTVASAFGYPLPYFSRRFRQYFGVAPSQWNTVTKPEPGRRPG